MNICQRVSKDSCVEFVEIVNIDILTIDLFYANISSASCFINATKVHFQMLMYLDYVCFTLKYAFSKCDATEAIQQRKERTVSK